MRVKRFFLAIAVCGALVAAASGQQPVPNSQAAGVSADEQQIRQAALKFVELYNAHQAADLAKLFAPDARVVYRDGSEENGQGEIEQSFRDAFEASPKTAISLVVDSIRFLTPQVAVEEGFTSQFPDGETLTTKGHYTVLHLKRDGRWLMQSVRVVEVESQSAYGELQALEWLVGDWVDEGRTEVVEARFRWAENKSFLLEEFQVVREGSVVLKGTQRIGWDPQRKQIRSWVFDSAGGFGEAWWALAGNDWVCKGTGVQADGTSVSTTRILARATPDRVLWMAVDRLMGSERLPDLSVTMVRKPPQPELFFANRHPDPISPAQGKLYASKSQSIGQPAACVAYGLWSDSARLWSRRRPRGRRRRRTWRRWI